MPSIIQIKEFDSKVLDRVLRIHDEMPLQWDPLHQPRDEWRVGLLNEMEKDFSPHGIWIIQMREQVLGELWAVKRESRVSINSVWIAPELRQNKWLPKLANEVISWAQIQGSKTIEVSTHAKNFRMQEILKSQNFEPAYTTYLKSL